MIECEICGMRAVGRRLCRKHYARLWKRGLPELAEDLRKSPRARRAFMPKHPIFHSKHPLYVVWNSMRDRCNNPNNPHWGHYGGRGISVCARWDSFQAFAEDMGDRPRGTTLERSDNDAGYSPSNCRWASRKEQAKNRRVARFVVIEGIKHRAMDLAAIAGVKTDTVMARAAKGMSYAEVVCPDHYSDTSSVYTAAAASSAARKARTHCKNGHEWTPENTGQQKGGRYCKACHRAKVRRQNEARRDAALPSWGAVV